MMVEMSVPFFLQSINHVTSNNIIDSFDSKDVSSPTSNQSGNSQSTPQLRGGKRRLYNFVFFFLLAKMMKVLLRLSSSTKRRQKKYLYKS
jgi:hypothetical protein